MLFPIFEAAVLAMSLSVDAFAVAFAYGCKKIRIPTAQAYIINVICTGITGLSFLAGRVLAPFIHSGIAVMLSFSILFIIGISKLFSKGGNADAVSECISKKEAAILAVSLSLDGFAVGFGAALLGFNGFAVVMFSFLANGLALRLGSSLGNKAARSLPFNISWSTGVLLIGLAVTQLLV